MPKILLVNLVAIALSGAAIAMAVFVSGCSNQAANENAPSADSMSGTGAAPASNEGGGEAHANETTKSPGSTGPSGSSTVRNGMGGGSYARTEPFGGSGVRSGPYGGSYVRTAPYGSTGGRFGGYGGSTRGFSTGYAGAPIPLARQLDHLEQRTDEAERRVKELIESMQKK